MTRHHRAAWLLAAIAILAACTIPSQSTTPEESVAQGYAAVTALANTASAQLEAGRITPAQAAEIRGRLSAAYTGLTLAQGALAAGHTGDAEDYLTAAIGVLTELENRLKPKPTPALVPAGSATGGGP